MKILVLSDSHGMLCFMRRFMDSVRPDAVIHLGDMVCDADELSAEYPGVRFYQVAGNCDSGRVPADYPQARIESFLGNRVYLTHGHLHGVKCFLGKLMADARQCGADIVLYGHTHTADCRTEDGRLIMNSGSAGYGASAGVIEVGGQGRIQRQASPPVGFGG